MLNFIKILRQLSSSLKNPRSIPINMALEQNIRHRQIILANIHPERHLADPLNPLDISEECEGAVSLPPPHYTVYRRYAEGWTGEENCQSRRTSCNFTGVCGPAIFWPQGRSRSLWGDTLHPSKASVCRAVRHLELCGHVKKDARVHPFPAR